MSGPCSKCKYFSVTEVPLTMREAGFGRCAQMRGRWQYQSEMAACAFVPSRFVEHRAKAVDKSVDKSVSTAPDQLNIMPDELTFE